MKRLKRFSFLPLLGVALFLGFPLEYAHAQWGQPSGQQVYPPQQYQQQQPPGQAPVYPQQQGYPVQPGSSSTFSDALGRFRMNLPQGAVPTGATYNFSIPAAMCQVSVMTLTQDQMFQMQQQNFPNMLRQMGATIDTEQPMDVGGRPARLVSATMRDQMSGMSMHSMNVFISSANLWVQVMGPEQKAQQLSQILQSILSGLQY